MTTISVWRAAGDFAESKEVAKKIREKEILPRLRKGKEVTLDFTGVSIATQSFVHALIAEAIRQNGGEALDRVMFSGCNIDVRSVIEIVVSYCQEDWSEGTPSEFL